MWGKLLGLGDVLVVESMRKLKLGAPIITRHNVIPVFWHYFFTCSFEQHLTDNSYPCAA